MSEYVKIAEVGRRYISKKKRHRKKHPPPSIWLVTWGMDVGYNVLNRRHYNGKLIKDKSEA